MRRAHRGQADGQVPGTQGHRGQADGQVPGTQGPRHPRPNATVITSNGVDLGNFWLHRPRAGGPKSNWLVVGIATLDFFPTLYSFAVGERIQGGGRTRWRVRLLACQSGFHRDELDGELKSKSQFTPVVK